MTGRDVPAVRCAVTEPVWTWCGERDDEHLLVFSEGIVSHSSRPRLWELSSPMTHGRVTQ